VLHVSLASFVWQSSGALWHLHCVSAKIQAIKCATTNLLSFLKFWDMAMASGTWFPYDSYTCCYYFGGRGIFMYFLALAYCFYHELADEHG
jgi:hypothetical protein